MEEVLVAVVVVVVVVQIVILTAQVHKAQKQAGLKTEVP